MHNNVLKLEITDRCNAACVYCSYPRLNKDMHIDAICSIIDQLPEVVDVEPQHLGEPLLHPEFATVLSYLKCKGKQVSFHTNGSLLSGELAKAVAEFRPKLIRYSVDADNENLYRALRPGLSWDKLLDNIAQFNDIKSPETLTQVAILSTQETRPYLNRIKTFWEPRVDRVVINPELPKHRDLKGSIARRSNCWKVGHMITIKVDGDIVLCCEDWEKLHVLGNVAEGIGNVLNSAKAKRYFKAVKSGKMLEACKKCSVFWEGDNAT